MWRGMNVSFRDMLFLLVFAYLVIGAVDHSYPSFTPNITTNGGSVTLLADNSITLASDGIIDTTSSSGSGAVSLTGSGVPLSTQSPYLGLNYIIATQGIFPSRN